MTRRIHTVAFLLAGLLAAWSGPATAQLQGQVIRIGIGTPLTGGAATFGVAVTNAVELAIDEQNGAGGRRVPLPAGRQTAGGGGRRPDRLRPGPRRPLRGRVRQARRDRGGAADGEGGRPRLPGAPRRPAARLRRVVFRRHRGGAVPPAADAGAR